MKLPFLMNKSEREIHQTNFLGYNHTENCSEGEFYDMKNMSSDLYPVLSQRTKRGVYLYPDGTRQYKATSLISKDALCYISGTSLFINNEEVLGFEIPEMENTKLISMGAYIIIYPQKMYINTSNTSGDKGYIEAKHTVSGEQTVKFSLAKADGTLFGELSTTKPSEQSGTRYYLDTSVTPNVVKEYSETSKSWVPVSTTCIEIQAAGVSSKFNVGDGIEITGIENEELKHLNGFHTVQYVSETADSITIIGMISSSGIETSGSISFKREMPDMDFIVESQNRLWGCKYGINDKGQVVNEIYASSLGDFKNWNVFSGIASDSYSVAVGSDGVFTGAVTFQGNPMFFKENCVHKIFGSIPANFQVQTTACNGVERGSEKSLCIVNNTLFYKGIAGIYAYDGSLPVFISQNFGNERYKNAVSGVLANKYYVSLQNVATNTFDMMVFDTGKGLWHKEEGVSVVAFENDGSKLYYITSDDDLIHMVEGENSNEEKIKWFVETGVLGKDTPNKKEIKKINARMRLSLGSRVHFFIEYDSFGGWQHVCTVEGRNLQSFSVPLRLRRCDHMRLRIEGEGSALIYSLTQTISERSDK